MAELSLVSVVLFIATGGLVFILLFLFAKRQITRFTLKSARRPHVSIGYEATKEMKHEIQSHMARVGHFQYDPVLLTERVQMISTSVPNHYHYRMKALDAYTNAIQSMRLNEPQVPIRLSSQTVRQYIFALCPSAVTDPSNKSDIVNHFCDLYIKARHDPEIFDDNNCIEFMEHLDILIRLIKGDSNLRLNRSRLDSTQFKETTVIFQRGRKGQDDAKVTLQPTTTPVQMKSPEVVDQRTPVDQQAPVDQQTIVSSGMSSGYSSTDHSSSPHGSAEKLVDVTMLHKPV